jgi:hypothetical protein
MRRDILFLLVCFVIIPVISAQEPLLVVQKTITPNSISIDDKGISSEDITINLTVVPQKVNRVDADVVLAIDCSSSMYGSDKDFLRKSASKVFIGKLDPSKDRVGVVLWNDKDFALSPLSSDFQSANRTLDNMPNIDIGSTNFDIALNSSLNLLSASSRAKDTRVSHSVIFLTDGNPEGSGVVFNKTTVSSAANNGYRIYAVGLDTHPLGEPVLKEMAYATNAIYIKAKTRDSLLPIYSDLSKIIPYEVLASKTKITDILPPYLESPRESNYEPHNYIYENEGNETLDVKVNEFDKTKTLNWTWGIVPANGVPLTLSFKTKFIQPLPADVISGKERTEFNSQLTYIDSQGRPRTAQIEAGSIYLKNANSYSVVTTISIAAGSSVISIGIVFSLFSLRARKKEKNERRKMEET